MTNLLNKKEIRHVTVYLIDPYPGLDILLHGVGYLSIHRSSQPAMPGSNEALLSHVQTGSK